MEDLFRPARATGIAPAAAVVHTCCSNALVEDLFDE